MSDPNNSLPDLKQAEQYLCEAAQLNPGPWEPHSRYVAQAAQAIAARHPDLDSQRAYILGLLHDIGRRYGKTHMRHVLDGYRYLSNEGYEAAARICLTHSYPHKDEIIGATHWDGSDDELQFVRDYIAHIEYDDYDRLIQLCDCLALPNGYCLMEKRMVDVVMRYGLHDHTLSRWKAFFKAKEHFESLIGISIYHLLPGVVENTFGW
ncbi:MAG: HD domain-containing protein [Anaerolineales bacterium]|nr:HD domain-containing protein [Anaerolineales bacterium]